MGCLSLCGRLRARTLAHSGSGRSEYAVMAGLLIKIAGSRDALLASDLGSVTLGSPLDPVVGGSL
jgi:hypothetical protein